jgi:hypothetical protein
MANVLKKVGSMQEYVHQLQAATDTFEGELGAITPITLQCKVDLAKVTGLCVLSRILTGLGFRV